jgi:hypothetical protein
MTALLRIWPVNSVVEPALNVWRTTDAGFADRRRICADVSAGDRDYSRRHRPRMVREVSNHNIIFKWGKKVHLVRREGALPAVVHPGLWGAARRGREGGWCDQGGVVRERGGLVRGRKSQDV